MLRLGINAPEPIAPDQFGLFTGMAFDGDLFYFLPEGHCEIVVYDQCFCMKRCVRVKREYMSLCYDTHEHCFWAIAWKKCDYVFQLNRNLEEIDRLRVSPRAQCFPNLTGVCCTAHPGRLLVAFSGSVVEISKRDACPARMWEPAGNLSYQKVVCVGEHRICMTQTAPPSLWHLNDCGACALDSCLPEGCTILDIAACGCVLYILLCCCRKNILIKACLVCEECAADAGCPCTPNCAEVMESVALMEVALAHILNAEGEKLQKAICCAECLSDLLCVNDSVRDTVAEVARLESLLLDKLRLVV